MKKIKLIVISFFILTTINAQQKDMKSKKLLIRCDDFGMCHSVNMAFQEAFESGVPVSASTLFVCPWYQEAVEILKNYPDVSVGVHLALTSEWKNYKWGPVLGKEAVPSLVDSNGYFFYSNKLFHANNPKIEEVEKELRAQIERALNSGIQIDYMDAHMFTAASTPELKKLIFALAKEYKLGLSEAYEEQFVDVYDFPYEEKKSVTLSKLDSLEYGINYLLVYHLGKDTPELQALKDMNEGGLEEISKHRQAELNIVISDELKEYVKKKNIQILTYREFIEGKEPVLPDELKEEY